MRNIYYNLICILCHKVAVFKRLFSLIRFNTSVAGVSRYFKATAMTIIPTMLCKLCHSDVFQELRPLFHTWVTGGDILCLKAAAMANIYYIFGVLTHYVDGSACNHHMIRIFAHQTCYFKLFFLFMTDFFII